MRYLLAQRYGLDFHLTEECRRVKFFTPDSAPVAARPVIKAVVMQDKARRACVVFFMGRLRML